MYLSSVRIVNYRNFADTSIVFKSGVNVVIGPNNSGKTNLLKAITFLSNRKKLSVTDFNHNNLNDNIDSFKEIPPKIEIFFKIEHAFRSDTIDSAIIKLKNFIKYETDGGLVKQDGVIYLIQGELKLVYELNSKFVANYKSEMSLINEVEDDKLNTFIKILEGFMDSYEWQFYNSVSEQVISKSDVENIFRIDFIQADRTTENLMPETKRFIKDKIDEKDGLRLKVRRDISQVLSEDLAFIVDDMKSNIQTDQDSIGISQGNNKIQPSFDYDSSIDEHFQFYLQDVDNEYRLPLNNNGLGYNNLVQIYNIVKFKISDDYNILLIEEPEAHLHPAMQYKLFKYLQNLESQEENKIKNQIIVTTHSPNISASSNIDDIVSLQYYRNKKPFYVIADNLVDKFLSKDEEEQKKLNDSKKHLVKFLDVTRSDMLFTQKVILVEGLAEKLLMPLFAAKEGLDLIDNHVSIVEIGGIAFNHYLPLFVNTQNKVLCVRDLDFNYFEKGNFILSKYENFKGEKKIIDIKYDQYPQTIKAVTQQNFGSTFENELFLDNFNKDENNQTVDTVCKLLLKKVVPEKIIISGLLDILCLDHWKANFSLIEHETVKNKVEEFLSPYIIAYDNEVHLDIKHQIEKVAFANLFLEYAKSKKGDLALSILLDSEINNKLLTPNYIKEGLRWIK